MFCPKCGDRLERIGHELTCRRGDMGLSQDLEKRLAAAFAGDVTEPQPTPFPFEVGGTWFCPADAMHMDEKVRGLVACPTCGRSLNRFLRALIELHPHAPRPGDT